MYVCGRGTAGHGTILPAIYEWHRQGWRGDLVIAGTRAAGVDLLRSKIRELNAMYQVELEPRCLPESGDDPRAFAAAIAVTGRPGCAIVAVPDHLHTEVARATIGAG